VQLKKKESYYADKIEIKSDYYCIYENDHYSLEIMDEFKMTARTTTDGWLVIVTAALKIVMVEFMSQNDTTTPGHPSNRL
jgi:hypothetical protein